MAEEPAGQRPQTGRSLIAGVRGAYARIPSGRRGLVLAVAGAVALGLVVMVASGGDGAAWRPLARSLAPEDLAAATQAFEDKKIPHRLADGGAIEVPAEKLHEARLALAVNVMPSGKSVGFEVFDESGMGRSAFTEKVNLHRALEGELARTIRHIEGIERARVHLVTPERRVFRDQEATPSASVIVSLRPGFVLERAQAQAIRQLVAGAIERLDPGRVSIVDQHGRMVVKPDDLGVAGGAHYERQREQEQALEAGVVRLLEPVVGAQKVIARVAIDLDVSRVVETREDFDPTQQVLRSERAQIDSDGKARAQAAGAPGTASNLPGGAGGASAAAAQGAGGRDKSDTVRNYEIDKTVTRREDPLPRVRKLSVAVLIDEAVELVDGKPVSRPRTQEELDRITRLVSHAVGLDATRGDSVEVTSVPFALEEAPVGGSFGEQGEPVAGGAPGTTEGTSVVRPPWQEPWVLISAGAGILLLVVGLLVWRARRRKKGVRLSLSVQPSAAELAELTEVSVEPPIDRRQRISELREQALELANEDVHRLTMVFERWFEQDEGRGEDEGAVAAKEAA